jgi:hypothetical protein
MTEKSVIGQLEEPAPKQAEIRATEALSRLRISDPEGVREYLSSFEEVEGLVANQASFMSEIKRIRSDVNLSDAERLQAASLAHEKARARHKELAGELARQTDQRAQRLNKKLYAGCDRADLAALADLDKEQLDSRVELARTADDVDLLRAVRTAAAAKGHADIVAKTVDLDPDPQIADAHIERERLATTSLGALEALTGAYFPPPVTEQQLQPNPADMARAKQVRLQQEAASKKAHLQQEAASKRILSGNPGIIDMDFSPKRGRRVGRRTL